MLNPWRNRRRKFVDNSPQYYDLAKLKPKPINILKHLIIYKIVYF